MTQELKKYIEQIHSEEEIIKRFTYHPPKKDQIDKYTSLREKAKEFALLVNETCPESREKAFAFQKIEEAIGWANAAIARRS